MDGRKYPPKLISKVELRHRIPTWKRYRVFSQQKCTPDSMKIQKVLNHGQKPHLKMPQNATGDVSHRICHDRKATQKDVVDYQKIQ